ncbi:SDR family oxidoreductase [Fontisphaera persica]|uniref:SDR family oxidoreductase n=1 Tax=Fontisphaera persica TaxID=2974023 RepID=UPI0024C0D163|nr:SDR family oxidoreductase [Fontisphaera persica]WCJ59129.1 SDR family oxidoreductase [Fontisphaera persica]
MRALIIGCGYVGTALAEQLLQRGVEVHAVRRQAVELAPPSLAAARWWTVDITQRDAVRQLQGKWDAVINCVSSSRGGVEVYRQVFLEAAGHLREIFTVAPPVLYVHLSSTSVYGQTDGQWVTEDSPTEPANETARILVATEHQWREAAAGGMPVAILRLAGIYGPGRCYWLNQFLAGQARLDESSGRFLNMIHREDVVQAILAVLDHAGRAAGRVYNVADDGPVTARELFGWLAQQLGRPLPPEMSGEVAVPRKRALTNKRVSNARLKAELGWRPRYPTYREGFLPEIQRLQREGGWES